jgi:hypothetical protein
MGKKRRAPPSGYWRGKVLWGRALRCTGNPSGSHLKQAIRKWRQSIAKKARSGSSPTCTATPQRLGHSSIKVTELYLQFLTADEQLVAKGLASGAGVAQKGAQSADGTG